MKITEKRLDEIRHVLGSCMMSTFHQPTIYMELIQHIDALQAELNATPGDNMGEE